MQTENMSKKMLIDATHAEETRVVVVDGNKVEEFDFESENKRQLAGNIYLAKVTRVEPSLQAAFVDYGGNRHGFLAFSEIHPDYYQIPIADRRALMEEEAALAAEEDDEDRKKDKPKSSGRSRSRRRSSSKSSRSSEASPSAEATAEDTPREISGMETIDLSDEVADGQDDAEQETVSAPAEVLPAAEPDTPPVETADTQDEAKPDAEEGEDAAENTSSRPLAEASEEDSVVVTGEPGEDFRSEPAIEEADEAATASDGEDDDTSELEEVERDETIESVADDDTEEDIRPVRKPSRTRRYKIQEVIKVRQIMLVQVVKEERGNKGAALTTYLSLAGRYCVLMPNTARGGGISRKITNAADRSKLKEIANEIDVPKGAGLIIRTAGAKRTKTEIKRDYEYLQRLWEQIRELTLQSIAPAKIYEEGDLIKRSIRDLYSRDIEEVLVEGERGYRVAKDFMKMIMPSHAKNVKHYSEQMPLFARHQVESYLSGMFNPTVQLKSGGYIVIGVTEALVAIDVNSGRATKEGSIEETALKTNLEAAEEVARQLRLRDLAGLIVIDFIDMDERKNNAAVEKRLKDKLKTDRARIQVGRISGFGLLEMSRQRLRPGMIEATTQPCAACHGTGLIRSDDNMALQILRQIEEEGVRRRSREVLVKCPVAIANYLMNAKREHIAMIEARYGMSVRIEADVHLIAPDFSIEKFKTATRSLAKVAAPVVSVDTSLMDQIDEEAEVEDDDLAESDEKTAETSPATPEGEDKPKKKRRRRRRRSSKSRDGQDGQDAADLSDDAGDAENPEEGGDATGVTDDADPILVSVAEDASGGDASVTTEPAADAAPVEDSPAEKPKKRSTRSRSSRAKTKPVEQPETDTAAEAEAAPQAVAQADPDPQPETEEATAETKPKPKRSRARKKAADAPAPETSAAEDSPQDAAVVPEPAATPEQALVADVPQPDNAAVDPAPEAASPEQPAEDKPKKRGWWSLGR